MDAVRHRVGDLERLQQQIGQTVGERVCLAIILRNGTRLDGDALLAHLSAGGLSKYDMPEYFVTLDAFPLTASGKILKRELVELTRAGKITPEPVRWKG